MKMQEFYELLAEKPELAEKLSACETPQDAYALAQEAGLDETFETFAAEMEKMSQQAMELNPEDVDAIVGGATTTEIVTATASTVGAAASAGAAAAV